VIEGSLRAQNLASSMEKPTPYAGAWLRLGP
jgi:hypothetical protein